MAVTPPVQLATEKQRRLCLVAVHVECATYGAAVASRVGPNERAAGHLRPIARTTPIVLDADRLDLRIPTLRAGRASAQGILVGVLGIAFLAILIARPSGREGTGGGPGAGVTAPPRSSVSASGDTLAAPSGDGSTDTPASASPTTALAETAAPTDAPGDTPPPGTATAEPSGSQPAPTQEPTAGPTYKVRSGDTLSAIAARFGTTWQVLADLNGISDPARLKIGQVLRLP